MKCPGVKLKPKAEKTSQCLNDAVEYIQEVLSSKEYVESSININQNIVQKG